MAIIQYVLRIRRLNTVIFDERHFSDSRSVRLKYTISVAYSYDRRSGQRYCAPIRCRRGRAGARTPMREEIKRCGAVVPRLPPLIFHPGVFRTGLFQTRPRSHPSEPTLRPAAPINLRDYKRLQVASRISRYGIRSCGNVSGTRPDPPTGSATTKAKSPADVRARRARGRAAR